MKYKKLNAGCGEDYLEGYVNLDKRRNCKTDIVHDLNKYPYPFSDNYFDECLLKMVLGEGLNDVLRFLKEIVRITKPKGEIIIIGSHALSYSSIKGLNQNDVEINENTFTEYKLREFELEKLIKLNKQEFIFKHKWKKYIPFKNYLKIFLRGLYDDIKFEFEVIKDEPKK